MTLDFLILLYSFLKFENLDVSLYFNDFWYCFALCKWVGFGTIAKSFPDILGSKIVSILIRYLIELTRLIWFYIFM